MGHEGALPQLFAQFHRQEYPAKARVAFLGVGCRLGDGPEALCVRWQMRYVALVVLLCVVLALLLLASGLFGLTGYRWSQRRNQLASSTS